MKRIFYLVLGISFLAIGLFFMILYLNLFAFGYTFLKYVYFISRRVECLIIIPGFFFLVIGHQKKGR